MIDVDQIGLAQVIIAIVSVFLAPVIPAIISRIAWWNVGSLKIYSAPKGAENESTSSWVFEIVLNNYTGRYGDIFFIANDLSNTIVSANEIRLHGVENRLKRMPSGYIQVNTDHAPPDSRIKIHFGLLYPGTVSAYLRKPNGAKKFLKCEMLYENHSDSFANIRQKTLLVAKWRALWVAGAFANYAIISLIRIFYLGFFKN